MFTKQHYEVIAKMVEGNTCVQLIQEHPAHYILKDTFVKQLADFLENDNHNFNRERFYKACLYNKAFAVV